MAAYDVPRLATLRNKGRQQRLAALHPVGDGRARRLKSRHPWRVAFLGVGHVAGTAALLVRYAAERGA
jgi:hypothetical protein